MEFDLLKGNFTKKEANLMNPLILALIGDGVYEVFVRTFLVNKYRDMNVQKIHLKTVNYVKAEAQSNFMKVLVEDLNEEELTIFKRGRNTKSCAPKNADITNYRWATGFEALIGYLYITDNKERLNSLLNKVIQLGEEENA